MKKPSMPTKEGIQHGGCGNLTLEVTLIISMMPLPRNGLVEKNYHFHLIAQLHDIPDINNIDYITTETYMCSFNHDEEDALFQDLANKNRFN